MSDHDLPTGIAPHDGDVWISASGVRLFGRWAEGRAAGGVLVLLSGLGFHSFEYQRLQVLLAQGGWSSLALDHRGHGRSGGARGTWTLGLLVADTRAAIDRVTAARPGPVVLLGNSLGAMVAVATGARDPRVAAVVASNCPARVGDFLLTPFRRALFGAAKLLAPVASPRIGVDHFYTYRQLIEDPGQVQRLERDPLIAPARRLSVRAYRALLEEWDGPREVSRLGRPLLLVQGTRDRLQPADQTDLLLAAAKQPRSLVRLDAGHLPTLERPEALAAAVLAWLTTLDGAG